MAYFYVTYSDKIMHMFSTKEGIILDSLNNSEIPPEPFDSTVYLLFQHSLLATYTLIPSLFFKIMITAKLIIKRAAKHRKEQKIYQISFCLTLSFFCLNIFSPASNIYRQNFFKYALNNKNVSLFSSFACIAGTLQT